MALAIAAPFHAEKNMLSHPIPGFSFLKSRVAHRQQNTIKNVFNTIVQVILGTLHAG